MSETGFLDALELLRLRQEEPKLTTGSADLDSLLGGGVQPDKSYLFYGDEKSGVDLLLHRILINALLPVERGGLGGKALYLNCGNYREERTLLDVRQLTSLTKAAGLDPAAALDRISVFLAFNPDQEEQVAEKVAQTLRESAEIKVLVVHSIAKLFDPEARPKQGSPEKLQRIIRLQGVVSKLLRICAERGIAIVASCRPGMAARSFVPAPEGGRYLRHTFNVLVYMRRADSKRGWAIQAHLRKHPNREPRQVTFTFRTGGLELGRITTPFRTMFEEELDSLRLGFREALLDPARREAFDKIVKGWTSELGAMSYAKVPTVLDVMLLTAAIDNRKAVEETNERIRAMGRMLEEIKQLVKELSVPVQENKTVPERSRC